MRRRGSDWKDPDPIGRLMSHDFFRLRPSSPVGLALSSARRDEFISHDSHDSLDDATVRGLFSVRHEPGPTLVVTSVRYHDDVVTVSRSAAGIVVTTSSQADGVEVDVAAADNVEVIVRHWLSLNSSRLRSILDCLLSMQRRQSGSDSPVKVVMYFDVRPLLLVSWTGPLRRRCIV